MSKKYKNPPIIEAVCEFRLPPDSKWDLTIPGLLYEKLHKEFPQKEQRFKHEITTSEVTPISIKQEIKPVEIVAFFNKDRKILIQIASRRMSINCLKPYPTWERYRPKIELALKTLTDTINVMKLQRIGLRYINHIELSPGGLELNDYFDFRPHLGEKLPKKFSNFIVGCTFSPRNSKDTCKIQLSDAVPKNPANRAFFLDLDYFISNSGGTRADEALEWTESAHEELEKFFEGCIRNRLREIFGEVK